MPLERWASSCCYGNMVDVGYFEPEIIGDVAPVDYLFDYADYTHIKDAKLVYLFLIS